MCLNVACDGKRQLQVWGSGYTMNRYNPVKLFVILIGAVRIDANKIIETAIPPYIT